MKHLLLIVTLLLVVSLGWAQRTITGTITDDEGLPLTGANVLEVGTTNGAVTDINGNFQITVSDDASLRFSLIGFEEQTVAVGASNVIDITLSEGIELEEVVITALGISRKKKSLGYAVETLTSDEISKSGQPNLVSAIQAKVPGVYIQKSSGTPGAGIDMLIRGITSLDPVRSNRPLYIIDGIEVSDETDALPIKPSAGSNAPSSRTQASVSSRIVDINPEDIESLSVLKGAQASALYGIRAANGVVIITTKKGKAGETKTKVHFGAGWEEANKVPAVTRKYIDGNRSSTLRRSFIWDTWGAKVFPNETDPTRDVYSDFFRTGTMKNFGASVATGTDKLGFKLGLDRFVHEGIIPGTEWNKTNISLNSQIKFTDKFTVSPGLLFAKTGGNRPHEGDKSILSTLSYIANIADVNKYNTPYDFGSNFAVGIIDHPLFLAENNRYEDDVVRFIPSTKLKYDIKENISLNYTIGFDNINEQRTRLVHPETDEGNKVTGFLVDINNRKLNLTSTAFVTGDFELTDKIKLTALLGHYLYTSKNKWISTRGETFSVADFWSLDNTSSFFPDPNLTRYRNVAVFAEATLGYEDYLFLTLTGRNDWSSTLPKKNNSYFFPSASLTWIFSDMMELPEQISYGKLRLSYAIVGKDASPYSVGRYFEKAANFPFGSVLGFKQSARIGDENLKPEFTKSFEIGAEIRFLDNRYGLDFSYYKNDLTDMILPVPISNSTGASVYITNAGAIQTSGIEIAINANPIKTADFSWNTSLNWATSEGKVEEIDEAIEDIVLYESRGITNKYVRGGKIGDIYGYAYNRTKEGDLIIDANGFPSVVWDSVKLMGNAFPDWTAGWSNNFNYKGLSLSFLLEWKVGGDVFDLGRRNSIRNGQLAETDRRYESVIFNGVVEQADGSYTENTQAVEITPLNYYRNAARYNYAADVLLEDASWVRLRNVTLAYSLPKNILSKTFITAATVSLTANNVFLNTPYRGYDPETNYFGSGSNIYGYSGLKTPATRSYFFKLNLEF